uniref:Uncharacterized protein n=1 Tax=Ascaris lumbricoides TaxID=6252 RepID=A0A9J2PD44_ASCLU
MCGTLMPAALAPSMCPFFGGGGWGGGFSGYGYGPGMGMMCPEASIFYYYTCCEGFFGECCFYFQSWLIQDVDDEVAVFVYRICGRDTQRKAGFNFIARFQFLFKSLSKLVDKKRRSNFFLARLMLSSSNNNSL